MNYMAVPAIKRISKHKLAMQLVKERLNAEFNRVCEHYGYDPIKVKKGDKGRIRNYVELRMICMVLFKCKLNYSLTISAGYFGKDHSTASHAIKTIIQLRNAPGNFKTFTDPLLADVDFGDYLERYS